MTTAEIFWRFGVTRATAIELSEIRTRPYMVRRRLALSSARASVSRLETPAECRRETAYLTEIGQQMWRWGFKDPRKWRYVPDDPGAVHIGILMGRWT